MGASNRLNQKKRPKGGELFSEPGGAVGLRLARASARSPPGLPACRPFIRPEARLMFFTSL